MADVWQFVDYVKFDVLHIRDPSNSHCSLSHTCTAVTTLESFNLIGVRPPEVNELIEKTEEEMQT